MCCIFRLHFASACKNSAGTILKRKSSDHFFNIALFNSKHTREHAYSFAAHQLNSKNICKNHGTDAPMRWRTKDKVARVAKVCCSFDAIQYSQLLILQPALLLIDCFYVIQYSQLPFLYSSVSTQHRIAVALQSGGSLEQSEPNSNIDRMR